MTHALPSALDVELAALLGFVPLRFSPAMSLLAERMVGDLMHRLSQTEASILTGMERTAMLKQFRRESGMSFRTFKTSAGVQAALRLMAAGHSVSEAAMAGGFADLALFECGPVFSGGEPGEQETHLSGILIGANAARDPYASRRKVDIYDAKADAEAILAAIDDTLAEVASA